MLGSIGKQSGESVESVPCRRKGRLWWEGFAEKEGFKDLCLQCFDTVGWAAGRASGL